MDIIIIFITTLLFSTLITEEKFLLVFLVIQSIKDWIIALFMLKYNGALTNSMQINNLV